VSTMTTPTVTPQDRPLEPVSHDPFVDDLRMIVVRPSPRSRGFQDMGFGSRKRSIEPAS
jgi:hypothetical protein